MKKNLLITLLLTSILCLCACGSASDEANTSSQISPESEILTPASTKAQETETSTEEQEQSEPEFKYLPSRIIIDSPYFYYDEKIEYGEDGLTAHELCYDRDGNLLTESTASKVSDTGTYLDYVSVSYDSEGNVNGKSIHTYSEEDSSFVWEAYDANDELQYKVVTTTDEHGNLLKTYNYDKDGNETNYSENHNEYDDQDRLIFSAAESNYVESDNYTGYNFYITYEYKDDKKYTTSYSADYTVDTSIVYTGTVTPSTRSYTEYKYDENGNKVKETTYTKYSEDEEWTLESDITYEYTAFEVK